MAVVVPLEARGRGDRALRVLQQLVAGELDAVNAVILARMQSRVELIPALASHLIASGGKRLRPMLTLAAARMCGYEGERQVGLAACVEFIHTATLLHDDVVDASDLRRGAATANAVFGNEASVLVGDFLFSRAFQLMVEDGSLRVLEILSNTAAVIAEGEVAQLITNHDTTTGEDAYLDVVRAKTAALFAAACRIGAVIAGRPAVEEEALESYGRNLGIAFQLVDDALDYGAEQKALGKTVGDDFREGKDHPPGGAGLPPRQRRGARLLAPRPRERRPRGGRFRARGRPDEQAWVARGDDRARWPLWRDRPGRARHFRRQREQARPARDRRFLRLARPLTPGGGGLRPAAIACRGAGAGV